MDAVLRLEGVSKEYAQRRRQPIRALAGVDLAVDAGDFVVITGRSGSGKTTMLNVAAGLTRPTAGSAFLGVYDVWSMPDGGRAKLRNSRIGFVFQFPSLFPGLTLAENVIVPATFNGAVPASEARSRAMELLEIVGLAERADALPCELSAGQQQRVVIARALQRAPELLFADEPTSNLDVDTEREIISLFQEINTTQGVTVLMVTHGTELVSAGRRHITMAEGRIVSDTRASG